MTSHPPPNKPDGTRSVPTTLGDGTRSEPATNDPVAAQIEAEIADHLATAANELQSTGVAPDEARRKVETKFGDAASIGRRCYWIQQGDTIMFRYATIGLLVLLCLALAATTIGSWHSQTRMAEQMDALTHELRALAEAQQAAPMPQPVPAEPQPLEITGKVYIGTPDKPAANHEVTICRVSDGGNVRRVRTDAQGNYRSGLLGPGEYSVLAPLQGRSSYSVQTEPLFLYTVQSAERRDVNVQEFRSALEFEFSRPLPQGEQGGLSYSARVYGTLKSDRKQACRWRSEFPLPSDWPLVIEFPDIAPERHGSDFRRIEAGHSHVDPMTGAEQVITRIPLPLLEGECELAAVLTVNAVPLPSDAESTPERRVGFLSFLRPGQYAPGFDWYRHLVQMEGGRISPGGRISNRPADLDRLLEVEPERRPPIRLTLERGHATRLRVEVPDDLEERIERLREVATDANAFLNAVREDNPFIREATITIVGTEPLLADEAEEAADQP